MSPGESSTWTVINTRIPRSESNPQTEPRALGLRRTQRPYSPGGILQRPSAAALERYLRFFRNAKHYVRMEHISDHELERLNGDRIAAAQPTCSSRTNSHFRHEATCFSTFCFSASDASFKAYRSSSSTDRWATASTIADFGCHGFDDTRFWRLRRGGPVKLNCRSNRLKTWRRSHVNRLQIGR